MSDKPEDNSIHVPAWVKAVVVSVAAIVTTTVTVVVYASTMKSDIQQLRSHQVEQDRYAAETRTDMKEIAKQLREIDAAVSRVEGKMDNVLHRVGLRAEVER